MDVAAGGFGLGHRVKGEAGGVRTGSARHDGRAGTLAPDLQLLDRGGPERIASGEHNVFSLRPIKARKLADCSRLARPVDPDHEDHERLVPFDIERSCDGGTVWLSRRWG